jgi:hypothetical protein
LVSALARSNIGFDARGEVHHVTLQGEARAPRAAGIAGIAGAAADRPPG